MKLLPSLLAAATTLAMSTAAFAVTPITLVPGVDPDTFAGSFSGSAATNTFSLDLSSYAGVTFLDGQVSANFTGGRGYDVTGVTFDGMPFIPVINTSTASKGTDLWTLSLGPIASTMHTIVVTGMAKGGSTVGFTGSLEFGVTPVPEPETYAMMLAGLAALGFMARRRQSA